MTQHKFKRSLRRLNVKNDREQIFNELMTGKFPKLKITQVHLIKNGHQVLIKINKNKSLEKLNNISDKGYEILSCDMNKKQIFFNGLITDFFSTIDA